MTVNVPEELIERILDMQGTCRHDHHGYCQEHNLEAREDCWVYQLRELLNEDH